jgi:hypothetical protein
MNAQIIQRKAGQLPEELQREVMNYIEFLLSKYPSSADETDKFRFDWEGGFSKLNTQYSSVKLQHKALEWRSCI